MTHATHAWKLTGRVYLWRYRENTRNYPGWHLSTDRPGGASLLELFSLLPSASTPVYRTVPLTPPSQSVLAVPNNRGGFARIWAPTKWRVAFDPSSAAANTWAFPAGADPAVLTFGSSYLAPLVRGVSDILRHTGDYSIACESDDPSESSRELWFWW